MWHWACWNAADQQRFSRFDAMRRHFSVGLMSSLLLSGCSESDAEKLRRVGDKTFDRVTQLAQKVSEELGQTLLEHKPPATEPSILERVAQRIHWDRDLAILEIGVAEKEEALVLTGKVKNDALKQHAQDLAERTLGVQKVRNEIEVEEVKPEVNSPPSILPGTPN
jgi:osmotically-inducible protein OsmY